MPGRTTETMSLHGKEGWYQVHKGRSRLRQHMDGSAITREKAKNLELTGPGETLFPNIKTVFLI